MSSSSFCIFWKKFSLILCLNVFGFSADFKSDGRLFHKDYSDGDTSTKDAFSDILESRAFFNIVTSRPLAQ